MFDQKGYYENLLAEPGKAKGCFSNTVVKDIKIASLQWFKVTAILLNGWIMPIGGVTSGMICVQ